MYVDIIYINGSLVLYIINKATRVTDALSTMLRLLGEESEAASWLIKAWSRMELVEPYNEE